MVPREGGEESKCLKMLRVRKDFKEESVVLQASTSDVRAWRSQEKEKDSTLSFVDTSLCTEQRTVSLAITLMDY